MRIAAHGSLKRGSARLGSFCRFFPFAPRPKRSGVRACDGLATPRSPSIGSVILILMLIASFTAVFRAALAAH